jgi:predicted nucleic acid-binding protein
VNQVLVDSNVPLDVLTEDPVWLEWSASKLEECVHDAQLCINVLIYSEVSIGFTRIEELDDALPSTAFTRLPVPWEGAFLAGKAFVRYRRAKDARRSPLPAKKFARSAIFENPDLLIGAHAAIANIPLLTCDARRYRTYFPKLHLICPDTAA